MPREIIVRVSARTVLLTVLTLAVVWISILLHRVFILFFVATLLAVGISSGVNWLVRFKVPRSFAILLIYICLLVLLVGIGFVLVPLVRQQVLLLQVQLPRYIEEPLRQGSELIGERFPELRETLPTGDFARQTTQAFMALIGNVGNAALSIGRATMTFILNLLVVLVLSFFLISRPHVAANTIRLIIPPSHQDRFIRISTTIGRRLGRWVIAQLVIATFYAVFFGTGLALLGVPYAVALGVIGGLLELIPYVGGLVATILTMIVAFTVEPSLALWVLILHLIVGNIEVHVIAPKVMGHAVETHPVIAILALFSGIELMGIVGAFIAIPLAVVSQTLVEEFWIKPLKQRHAATVLEEAAATYESQPQALLHSDTPD